MNPEQSAIASITAPPSPISLLETREASPSTCSLWRNAPCAFASAVVSRPQSPSPLDRIDLDNEASPTCVADRFFDLDFKARRGHERGISFPSMTFLSRSDSDYSVESELSQLFDAPAPPPLLRITSQSDAERFARPTDPVARILLEQFSDADQDPEHLETFYAHHHDVQVNGRGDSDIVS
jgi:hypothetical protein